MYTRYSDRQLVLFVISLVTLINVLCMQMAMLLIWLSIHVSIMIMTLSNSQYQNRYRCNDYKLMYHPYILLLKGHYIIGTSHNFDS